MKPSPQIAALSAEPGLQRAAQQGLVAALAEWQCGPAAAVLAAFSRYAEGCDLADAAALAALFGDDRAGVARSFLAPLTAHWSDALIAQPFGIVPLRHAANRFSSSLLIAAEKGALLTLVALDGTALADSSAATSTSFASGEVWEVVIAGSGRGRLIERRGDALVQREIALELGLALGRDTAREALLVDRVEGVLLTLRLQRQGDMREPRREFALYDGRLLRQASASPAESRHEVAVTLLGKMGRSDAAPLLAEIARDDRHGDSLRWQALRECLGLDTREGFFALTAIARDGADPLAVPAGALRAQLLETYPQLTEIELCRA